MQSERREAQPWYGSSMSVQPQPEINGEPVRRRPRPAAPAVLPDRLYRYQPMPPAHYDADGYLIEDGMGQNSEHLRQTTLWYHALTERLPTVTVCSDLFLQYRKGDPGAVVLPDLFVTLKLPPIRGWTTYKLWEHPVPDLVIEMLSGSTSDKDVGSKRDTYECLGVCEYWLFDPAGHELSTALEGYRLCAKRYQPIDPDAAGRLRSKVLGLDLHVRNGELRFRDPATGEDLRTYSEASRERAAEKDRADAEQNRADAEKNRADGEKDRAEAEKNRADGEKNRAEAEKNRAEAEKKRADEAERGQAVERGRADAAERELAAARRELARLRSRVEGSGE